MFRDGKIPEGYQSPIQLIADEMCGKMENGVYTAVQNVEINVDKDELIKALQYDRKQYAKGYSNGYAQGYEDGIAETMRKLKEYIGGTE